MYVDGGAQVSAQLADLFPDIPGLFAIIADAIARNPFDMAVTYDPTTGVPVDVWIDYVQNIADEELGFRSTDLPAPTLPHQSTSLLFELIEWAARSDVELHLTVDDPDNQWANSVGVITTLFKEVEIFPRNTAAVVVGPPIMYKFVIQELLKIKIPKGNIWLSFERRMKCGVGKCGHCQMNHLYTCQAGPTYSYAEVEGLPEALG